MTQGTTILYKYVPAAVGRAVVETGWIGFSQPRHFNDPFELSTYPRPVSGDGPFAHMVSSTQHAAKLAIWAEKVAMLCLTRSPLNPLMWAHYTEGHRGYVLGIDVGSETFTNKETNLIPVQFGSVVYADHIPSALIPEDHGRMHVGEEFAFRPELLQKLQRLFLHKPLCWAYEEEVRIVKCIHGLTEQTTRIASGVFKILSVDARDLFLVQLPERCIREVYVGARVDQASPEQVSFLESVRRLHPAARIYKCEVGPSSWALEPRPLVGQPDGSTQDHSYE